MCRCGRALRSTANVSKSYLAPDQSEWRADRSRPRERRWHLGAPRKRLRTVTLVRRNGKVLWRKVLVGARADFDLTEDLAQGDAIVFVTGHGAPSTTTSRSCRRRSLALIEAPS
jgi:hypothetical protein